jgi:hypothetical protein
MMRSMAIGLAAILLLALASTGVFARGGHGGGGGGHWGGGGGGAHWSGGGARWSGGGARWSGAHWNGGRRFAFFHGARFRHRGPFFVGFAASDIGCWRMWPTAWGWRRVWVCGYPFYGYL